MNKMNAEYVDHMGSDLSCVNAARVSFAKHKDIMEAGDERLIHHLAKHNHWTPFAHTAITLRMKAPVPIRTQCFKHKAGFCVSGDTQISFETMRNGRNGVKTKSIESLYNEWVKHTPHSRSGDYYGLRKIIMKRPLRILNTDTDDFTVSNIENIIMSGVKDCYKITMSDGKNVSLTSDHRVYTPDGWKPLKDAIGLSLTATGIATMKSPSQLACNGLQVENSHLTYKNYDWMLSNKEMYGNIQDIADKAGCSYHTIRKWLKIHRLQFDQMESMRLHNETRGVWNKGVTGYKISTENWTEEKRLLYKIARSGENSNFWKGGMSSERQKINAWTGRVAGKVHEKYKWCCQKCGEKKSKLNAHHIVPVYADETKAYDFDNLITVCIPCHSEIHANNLEESFASEVLNNPVKLAEKPVGTGNTMAIKFLDVVKVEYVGEQKVYDLTVASEYHNFIGNGIVLHNCENEESRRYISSEPELFIPDYFRAKPNGNIKQGSAGVHYDSDFWLGVYERNCREDINTYMGMIEDGICPEQARFILPQGVQVNWIWTGNLASYARFYGLRNDPDAQLEIQQLAQMVGDIIKPLFPVSWAALTERD